MVTLTVIFRSARGGILPIVPLRRMRQIDRYFPTFQVGERRFTEAYSLIAHVRFPIFAIANSWTTVAVRPAVGETLSFVD